MSTIAMGAKVTCTDGPSGQCQTVIVNPVMRQVTHLVIADKHLPNPASRLVPLDRVVKSDENLIYLNCTRTELAAMELFSESHYVSVDGPLDATAYGIGDAGYEGMSVSPGYTGMGGYYALPYMVPVEPADVLIETEHIPPGELAVRRGMPVVATDGATGHVHALVVDADTGHISHVLVDRGHLLGKKEITVPLAAIDRVEDNTLFLRLDKHALDRLPAIAVTPHWFPLKF